MSTGKHLKFSNLRKTVSKRADEIVEKRQEGKIKHSMHDSCLSALAMMFFQDPSMLEFQRRLEDASQLNNLQKMFSVTTTPKDNQMRGILDNIPSEKLYPVCSDFFRLLQRGNHLNDYLLSVPFFRITSKNTNYLLI